MAHELEIRDGEASMFTLAEEVITGKTSTLVNEVYRLMKSGVGIPIERRRFGWRLVVAALVMPTALAAGAWAADRPRPKEMPAVAGDLTARELPKLTPEELFRRASPAVAAIRVQDATGRDIKHGSGFFVSKDGLLATNKHVIDGAASASIRLPDGTEGQVEGFIAVDAEADLALLKVTGGRFVSLEFARQPLPAIGTRVYAIGSPQGLENSLSEGLVSGIRRVKDQPFLQTTAAVSPGSSGGPMLDETGRVVGVICASLQGGQNLNFAVPFFLLKRLVSGPQVVKSLGSSSSADEKLGGQYFTSGLKTVDALLDQGKLGEALDELARIRPSHVGNPEYWSINGFVNFNLGNKEPALQSFINAKALYEKAGDDRASARCDVSIGMALQFFHKVRQDAIRAYLAVLRSDPASPTPAYDRLAFVYVEQGKSHMTKGNWIDAIDSYRQATRFKPDCLDAYVSLGSCYVALATLYDNEALKTEGRVAAEWESKARAAYQTAAGDYLAAIALDADNADAHRGAGRVMHSMGEYRMAAEELRKAVSLYQEGSARSSCQIELATTLRLARRSDEARAAIRSALAQAKSPITKACAYNELGLIRLQEDRPAEAVSAFASALDAAEELGDENAQFRAVFVRDVEKRLDAAKRRWAERK